MTKFHDKNANTTKGSDEPFLNGWEIFIDRDGSGTYTPGDIKQATAGVVGGVDQGTTTFSGLPTDTYSVCEVLQSGWYSSTPGPGAAGKQPCQLVTVTTGGNATATFGNYQKTKIKVVKTVEGLPPTTADGNITFTLRTGASTAPLPGGNGTTLETGVANAGNQGVINFTTELSPGTYQLCEVVPMGYDTSVKNGDWNKNGTPGEYPGDWFYPGIDPNNVATSSNTNEVVCIPFTVQSGDDTAGDQLSNTVVFTIDNGRPALQRTIGFWKNWASCSGSKGGQKFILDQTLAKSPLRETSTSTAPGFWVGDVFVDTCYEAVSLLSKAPISNPPTAKPKSSDPAFNAAAQYVAFQLNVLIPASTTCSSATPPASRRPRPRPCDTRHPASPPRDQPP